jgi:hypothetical protein
MDWRLGCRCLLVLAALSGLGKSLCGAEHGYAVVVSQATHADGSWREVVEALTAKHQAQVLVYQQHVAEVLPQLQEHFPRYACFVATPAEAGRQFVADVHRLTRKLDEDPYTDVLWGILTGYDAAGALRTAQEPASLVIERVAAGTELAMDRVAEGIWYCELVEKRMVRKAAGQDAVQQTGPSDTTAALVDTLNAYQAQLFVTSGHATERDWQIGFRYRNGTFQSQAGQLFGVNLRGERFPVRSENPKVYLPIGNCLMGHIDGPDAMALAFMHSAGVRQMIGYTVPTWYGYAGWGCLDYFVEQPGRFTFVEAFFANQHALLQRLETYYPDLLQLDTPPGTMPRLRDNLSPQARAAGLTWRDGLGLLHDRDVVALYGDPAWEARLATGKQSFAQTLREIESGVFELEIQPLLGDQSFAPVNMNGSQRGGRPFLHFLPRRIKDPQVLTGQDLQPLITDDFILLPHPGSPPADSPLRVVFKSTHAD